MACLFASQPAPETSSGVLPYSWHLLALVAAQLLPTSEVQELNRASSGCNFQKENYSCALESSVPIKMSGFETNKYG